MSITRTSSGTIFRTAFPTLEAGFYAVTSGTGTVAVSSGATLSGATGDNGACIYANIPLPSDKVFVVRTKIRVTNWDNADLLFGLANDTAVPAIYTDYEWATNHRSSFFDEYSSLGFVREGPGTYTVLGSGGLNADFILEISSDGTNADFIVRDPTTLAVITNNKPAWGSPEMPNRADNWYPVVGKNAGPGWAQIQALVKSFEGFISHNVAVTGLATGNAARLYDGAGTVLASAVESGGTATLDCSLVDWVGLSADLKVFADNTYASMIDSLVNITDASGGDIYIYAGGTPIEITVPDAATEASAGIVPALTHVTNINAPCATSASAAGTIASGTPGTPFMPEMPPIAGTTGNAVSLEVEGTLSCAANIIGYTYVAGGGAGTSKYGLMNNSFFDSVEGESGATVTVPAVAGSKHVVTGIIASSDKAGAVVLLKDGTNTVQRFVL